MAIYHCSVKTIGRSSGRSSVGSAAYRAGVKLYNEYDGMTHDYSKRKGVIYSEIILPENAPKEYLDRSKLWNAIEKVSIRKDARTAREIEVAIPIEFNRTEGLAVIKDYVNWNFVENGMCADIAIHDNNDNPHAHIMLTTRTVDGNGFGKTNRKWNDKAELESWRKSWADVCNEHLKAKGYKTQIDHRTLKAQGINREPTIHMGVIAHKMEKRGIKTERGQKNREINNQKIELKKIERELNMLEKDRKDIEDINKRLNEARKDRENRILKAREVDEQIKRLEKSLQYTIDTIERDRINKEQQQRREQLSGVNSIVNRLNQVRTPEHELTREYGEITRER